MNIISIRIIRLLHVSTFNMSSSWSLFCHLAKLNIKLQFLLKLIIHIIVIFIIILYNLYFRWFNYKETLFIQFTALEVELNGVLEAFPKKGD